MLKTVSSITNAIGALNYKGTWNASTNTPTLASGSGTKGDYYQVSVAGTTSIDGISNWGVGDVIAFNGTAWQRLEGGADLNGVNLSVSAASTLLGSVSVGSSTTPTGNASDNRVIQIYGAGTANRAQLHLCNSNTGETATDGSFIGIDVNKHLYINNRENADTIFENNGAKTMTVSAAGALVLEGSTAQKATGTTWSNPSDVRLKDKIRDYVKGTAELMQIRVREWEYNGKGGTVAGTKGLGVVADEAMLVLPDTVDNYQAKLNADDEEFTQIKKFDATEITWLLVNTVQEQQATIAALTASVAALESK